MALKDLKYLKVDDKKGVLFSAGQRSLLIPATFVRGLFEGLSSIISSSGAQFLVYKIGHDLGRQYVKTLRSILEGEKVKVGNKFLLMETYNAISTSAGWGRIKFNSLDLKKKEMEIEIRNTPSCQYIQKSCCSIERGILAGAYEEIFNKSVYFDIIKERSRRGRVILKLLKGIPADIAKKEKLLLVERKELEKMIEERTSQLNIKTKELERSKDELAEFLKIVEEAKGESEKRRRNMLSMITNFSDGIMVFDKDNILAFVNPQAERIFKVKAAEILGKTPKELAKNEKIKLLIGSLGEALNEVSRKELFVKEDLIVELTVIKLKEKESKLNSMIIIHDISREKVVDMMKSEFISVAAHQLRTPLSAIKWSLKMLIDGDLGEMPVEQKTLLLQTFHSNERMINLVNDLLNVAMIEEGRFGYEFSIIHLEDLISTILSDYTYKIKKKEINFSFKKPSKILPKIKIDHTKIRLAFQNLLDNAVKYTPAGGKVGVDISQAGKFIVVSVRDSGIGIPLLEQNRLFGKFYRSDIAVKRQTEGSGLGLFIAKNIIEKHGGKIGFKSRGVDRGCEFWFKLPIAG